MKKSVFEFIGLGLVALLIIFLVTSITITGFQIANTSTGDNIPDPEEIVNGSTGIQTTETDDLKGFDFISIEDYNSENFSRFPWITFIIILILIVILVLAVVFFFVFSKHTQRGVVSVQRPVASPMPIVQSSQPPALAPAVVSSPQKGLPLKATEEPVDPLFTPVKPVLAQQPTTTQPISQSQLSAPIQPSQPAVATPSVQPSSSQPSAPGNLSESLRYIKYYSHNMSKNPKIRIDYLIGQGKAFLQKNDRASAKQIYMFISEEYRSIPVHDERVYQAIVAFAQSLK